MSVPPVLRMSEAPSSLSQPMVRRDVLKAGLTLSAAAMLSAGMASPALALPDAGAYKIAFKNLHTEETFAGTYRVGNKYLPEAFERINWVLRDFRCNEIHPIDPRIIDIISIVHRMTGSSQPYGIISGYRSPSTNAHLREAGGRRTGVAKKSLHMVGQAIDVRLPDYSTAQLKKLAVKLHAGGVGYYRRSDFVHMDSGDFRTW